MHDVILIGGEDTENGRRVKAAEDAVMAAAEELARHARPGSTIRVEAVATKRNQGRYQMATLTDSMADYYDTANVHVVVSVFFLRHLPQYNLTPVAKDAFWVVVGQLANTDKRGSYVHMGSSGEIPITQEQIAKGCRVSRQTASGAVQQLMERSFVWKAGRGRYQIHPHLLYFGTSEKQSEAIGYARANRADGELPDIPLPGAELVLLTPKGVKRVIA